MLAYVIPHIWQLQVDCNSRKNNDPDRRFFDMLSHCLTEETSITALCEKWVATEGGLSNIKPQRFKISLCGFT
jgi:hypothetical protein